MGTITYRYFCVLVQGISVMSSTNSQGQHLAYPGQESRLCPHWSLYHERESTWRVAIPSLVNHRPLPRGQMPYVQVPRGQGFSGWGQDASARLGSPERPSSPIPQIRGGVDQ